MKRCDRLAVVGFSRGRGRSKKELGEVISQYIAHLQLIEDMTLDKKIWRSRISLEG